MGEASSNRMSREERLAAKLRENLRLRKAQARKKGAQETDQRESGVPNRPKGG